MASNTTEGVCQPTTCSLVTAAAGGPATSEDQFDPFLPAIEPAVDELSLQQSMDVNKECKYCLLFRITNCLEFVGMSAEFFKNCR